MNRFQVRIVLFAGVDCSLPIFGVMFGKRVGGFARRAEKIIAGELGVAPEMRMIVETLRNARNDINEKLKGLDKRVRSVARTSAPVRLIMSVPGVDAITALFVVSAIDDVVRLRRSSDVLADLGLTPRRYDSGDVSRTGRITKRGSKLIRTHLFEAANAVLTRKLKGSDR